MDPPSSPDTDMHTQGRNTFLTESPIAVKQWIPAVFCGSAQEDVREPVGQGGSLSQNINVTDILLLRPFFHSVRQDTLG